MYDSFCAWLPSFISHYYIKQKQIEAYLWNLTAAKEVDSFGVLQVDFSENFSNFWQDEVQSAYWKQKANYNFFFMFLAQDLCESAVATSDNLHHRKDSITVFIFNILQNIVKLQDRNIKKLHLSSDGAHN